MGNLNLTDEERNTRETKENGGGGGAEALRTTDEFLFHPTNPDP